MINNHNCDDLIRLAKKYELLEVENHLKEHKKYNEKKYNGNHDKLTYPMDNVNYNDIELIIKKIVITIKQEQPKPLSDDEKRRQAQLKEIERLKAQGKFNYNSTKSQSKDTGRGF